MTVQRGTADNGVNQGRQTAVDRTPRDLRMTECNLDEVVVVWQAPKSPAADIVSYTVRFEYRELRSPCAPLAEICSSVPVTECGFRLKHPDKTKNSTRLQACKLVISVESVAADGTTSNPLTKSFGFDDMCKDFPDTQVSKLFNEACLAFQQVRVDTHCGGNSNAKIQVLLIGGQHHGKSSLINHFHRVLGGRLHIPDEMETAPAGVSECSFAKKSSLVATPHLHFEFNDMPAISRVDREGEMDELLSHGIPDGTRRRQFSTPGQSSFQRPPDAAIVVISIVQWISTTEELTTYLQRLAQHFKHASGGTVTFPYAVAVTKCDEWLLNTEHEHPMEQLEAIKKAVSAAACTGSVYLMSNYKESSHWSERVNSETFKMLIAVVTLAKNTRTDKWWHSTDFLSRVCAVLFGIFALLMCMLVKA